jgi:hypothetical protein
MWNFLYAVKRADVVERVDARRQASVKTEDLIIDQSSEGKVIEEVGKVLPHIGIAVFPKAFVVKAVDLGNLTRFMISTQNGDALGVSDF